MDRYVSGSNTRNWRSPRDPVEELCCAIEEMEACFGDDDAFNGILAKLDEVEEELDWITASAGRRAVLRSQPPNHSGQEPGREPDHAWR
jgi:hypothetical protein